MQRVMIIGASGSGKSTLAARLGAALSVPVYHFDRDVLWLPGWEERSRPDQRAQVERLVAGEAWVIEGNNSRTFELREARAEMLIWLDLPLPLRLWRIIRRQLRYLGQTRPDMAEGCVEKLSMLPGFLWFVIECSGRTRRNARGLFDASPLPKRRLTSAAEANALVIELRVKSAG